MREEPVGQAFELTGSPDSLQLPDLCANCGVPGTRRLLVDKAFDRYSSDGPRGHFVYGARAPFCPSCVELHRREAKVITPLDRFFMCFRASVMLGAVFSGIGFLFFSSKLLPMLVGGDWKVGLLVTGVLGFFGLICYGSYSAARTETEHLAVIPQTSITSAFDFSDDRSQSFEPERHVYTMRNPVFGQALLQANAGRIWRAKGQQARSAASKRTLFFIAFLVIGGALLVWDNFKEILQPVIDWLAARLS